MKLYSVYILNKSGGLIYQRDLNSSLNKLTANDYLVLAGTLHGVHAIASKLKPIMGISGEQFIPNAGDTRNSNIIATGKVQNPNTNNSGLESIETDLFNLYVFQTLTGIKFVIVTSPNTVVHNFHPINEKNFSKGQLTKQVELANDVFKKLYVHYADFVMKDPFYSLEMPIKSPLFDIKVGELA